MGHNTAACITSANFYTADDQWDIDFLGAEFLELGLQAGPFWCTRAIIKNWFIYWFWYCAHEIPKENLQVNKCVNLAAPLISNKEALVVQG